MTRHVFGVLVVAVALAVGACGARPEFTADDRAALEARSAQIERASMAGNFGEVFDLMPPAMIEQAAKQTGADPGSYRSVMRDALVKAGPLMGRIVYSDLDLDSAEPTLTPDGKRTYLVIPTTTVVDISGQGRVRITGSTLALKDQGQWYFVSVSGDGTLNALTTLWPEFAEVEFPATITEPIR